MHFINTLKLLINKYQKESVVFFHLLNKYKWKIIQRCSLVMKLTSFGSSVTLGVLSNTG